MMIEDVMVEDVITIDANAPVVTACKIMGDEHIGCIIVTKNDRIDAIFTERDLLTKVIAAGHDLEDRSVGEFASKPLITIGPNYHVREAARIMSDMNIKRLLVVEPDAGLVGIFTASDLARVIARSPLEF